MPKMANQYRPWLAKCPVKTKWGSLIPRPLKMDEGLSTSKRQAEGEKQLGKWRIFADTTSIKSTIAIVILDLFASIKTKSFGDKLSLLGVHKNEFPKEECFTILENASSATAIYTDVIYDKKCETGDRISLR